MVIVIVFVSLGGLLFLCLCAFALFSFMKKRRKRTCEETEVINFDEHKKIKETIVSGPFGPQTVALTIEDDVHFDEKIKKNEKVGRALHAKSSSADHGDDDDDVDNQVITSSSHHEVQHKPTSHDH